MGVDTLPNEACRESAHQAAWFTANAEVLLEAYREQEEGNRRAVGCP
jgi:hypothetical protein